jgi:HK97 family phage portal protein
MPWSVMSDSLGFGRSDAGVMVNTTQAMRLSTVFTCIRVISEDLSRISLDIIQEMPDDSVKIAKHHKYYQLLHDRPNPLLSSGDWRKMMLIHMCLFGNGYSYIKRDNAARPISLLPLDPARTSLVQKEGQLLYATTFTQNGEVEYIDPSDMLHFRAGILTLGMVGVSPIQECKNMVGLGIALEKFSAQFFGNGARATGIFSHPENLDPEAYDKLKKSLYQAVTGDNALRPLILEEGMTYKQLTIPPGDCEFIDQRKFTKEEIAQVFRVPLHLLQDLTRATNANLEFQGTEYVRHCLVPYAKTMEDEIKFKLIGNGPFVAEHNFADLQRGDNAALTTSLVGLRNAGVYSANQVLKGLRQNPIPAEEGGNIRIVQGAFIPLDSLLNFGAEQAANATQTETVDTEADTETGTPAAYHLPGILNSYRPMFRDAVGRSINRANDPAFMKKAFYPVVNSLYQTYLAMRFGSTELTKNDLDKIGAITDHIVNSAGTWNKEKAAEIATQITNECFDTMSSGVYKNEK